MRKVRALVSVWLVCGLLCLMLGSAGASPMFSIHTQGDWEDVLAGGMAMAVDGTVFEEMVRGSMLWPYPYNDPTVTTFVTPTVYATEQRYEEEDALVMAWQHSATEYTAAAWDYVYPQDSDLTGLTISFSIFPPWWSTFFSLNLVDADDPNIWKEFIWHAPQVPGPNDPIAGQWNTVTVDLSTGTATLNPQVFETAGFDITNIGTLRFDENVPWPPNGPIPQGPLPLPPGGYDIFNLWNHVEVSPEPGTMVLVGSGLLVLLRRRRRKK